MNLPDFTQWTSKHHQIKAYLGRLQSKIGLLVIVITTKTLIKGMYLNDTFFKHRVTIESPANWRTLVWKSGGLFNSGSFEKILCKNWVTMPALGGFFLREVTSDGKSRGKNPLKMMPFQEDPVYWIRCMCVHVCVCALSLGGMPLSLPWWLLFSSLSPVSQITALSTLFLLPLVAAPSLQLLRCQPVLWWAHKAEWGLWERVLLLLL